MLTFAFPYFWLHTCSQKCVYFAYGWIFVSSIYRRKTCAQPVGTGRRTRNGSSQFTKNNIRSTQNPESKTRAFLSGSPKIWIFPQMPNGMIVLNIFSKHATPLPRNLQCIRVPHRPLRSLWEVFPFHTHPFRFRRDVILQRSIRVEVRCV